MAMRDDRMFIGLKFARLTPHKSQKVARHSMFYCSDLQNYKLVSEVSM